MSYPFHSDEKYKGKTLAYYLQDIETEGHIHYGIKACPCCGSYSSIIINPFNIRMCIDCDAEVHPTARGNIHLNPPWHDKHPNQVHSGKCYYNDLVSKMIAASDVDPDIKELVLNPLLEEQCKDCQAEEALDALLPSEG